MPNDEIWKTIRDFPSYEVSNKGRIRNKKTGRIRKPSNDRYLSVDLYRDGDFKRKNIHRLVAEAFIPRIDGKDQINHIDGDKHNNDVSNLEWCTSTENNRHAVNTGINHPGEYQKRPIRVKETGEIFDGVVECANAIGADFRNVYRSLNSEQNYAVNGLHMEYVNTPKKKPFLYDYQMDAVKHMFTGCILNGGVGSGKSRTALYYYFSKNGGSIDPDYIPMKSPKNLLILTTAMKRDRLEWDAELVPFLLSPHPESNYYDNNVIIDSWNNIKKYIDLSGYFIIFDEDRVTGSGEWVKAFYKIAKKNDWVILSATSGDTWLDYVPVFVANGFYRNRTDFLNKHVQYSRFTKYPKVERYHNTGRLIRLRNKILIDMDFDRHTTRHREDIWCNYDIKMYKDVGRNRWDPFKDEPIQNAAGLCYIWRRIVNSDPSRQVALLELFEKHPKMIVFYSFDYERDILLNLYYGDNVEIAEWSGHTHQPIPESDRWVYIVQYTAGAEGWNSIKTDTIVFFSQSYSYKTTEQAMGRIDRLNTPFIDLYYYFLKSRSGIDLAISKALAQKKNFNEGRFVKW